MIGLTPNEKLLVDSLGAWWNSYHLLDERQRHPNESDEVAAHIHALQNIILARVAHRHNAELFPWYVE